MSALLISACLSSGSLTVDNILAGCVALFTLALVGAVGYQIHDYRTRERAWMLVEIDGPEFFTAGPGTYRFKGRMLNLGETPARILKTEHRVAYLQRGEQLPPRPSYLSQPPTGEQTDYPLAPSGGTPLYWTGQQSAMDEVARRENPLSVWSGAIPGYFQALPRDSLLFQVLSHHSR